METCSGAEVVMASIIDFSPRTIFFASANIPTYGPQTVYYKFRQSITVARFSFRSHREKSNGNNPTAFDFIGSNDCKSWTTILSADGVTWNSNDELKTWEIKKPDQLRFKCFGIRVRVVDSLSFAYIQDIKMWKGEKVPARDTF